MISGKPFILQITSRCNNNCWSCARHERNSEKGLSKIELEVSASKENSVVICGGEPTLHPNFGRILSICAARYIKVCVLTNGRSASNPGLMPKNIPKNINFIVKIFSEEEELHDRLTRAPGSFQQTIKGIRNLASANVEVYGLITVMDQNVHALSDSSEMLKKLGVASVICTPVQSQGLASVEFKKIQASYTLIKTFIKGYVQKSDYMVHFMNFPLCMMDNSMDHSMHNILPVTVPNKTHLCNGCPKEDDCSAVYQDSAWLSGAGDGYARDKPLEVTIQLTTSCNMDCDYCNCHDQDGINLPLEKIALILDKITDAGIRYVRFTGGEIFTRPDILDIILMARKKGLRVCINTNGLAIDKKHILFLSEHVDQMLISFSDLSEERIEKLQIIKTLAQGNVHLHISTVATTKNIARITRYYDIVKTYPISSWVILRLVPSPRYPEQPSSEEYHELLQKIMSFRDVQVLMGNSLPFCAVDPKLSEKVPCTNEIDDNHAKLYIDATGRIRPSYYDLTDCGSIFDHSIMDIWNKHPLYGIRKLQILPPQCRSCRYLFRCRGGNRYIAKFASGNYEAPDPLARPEKILP